MAYGPWGAGVIQLGRETVAGTAVPATTIWRGEMASIQDIRTIQETPEHLGVLALTSRTATTKLGARLAIPETAMTFEQSPHVFEGAIQAATPSGAGPYVRAYAFPKAASLNTLKTYTIEAGNTVVTGENAEMAYSFVESFSLSGNSDDGLWKIASTWRGRQRTTTTLTGALSAPAVEDCLFAKTSLFIDAAGGTMGSTQKSGVLRSAEINVETGNRVVETAEGQQYFYAVKPHAAFPQITFSLQFELEDGAGVVAAERAIYASQAYRLIQLSIAGTSGRLMAISMAGRYTGVGDFTNADGNTVITLEGKCALSSADDEFFDISVTNNVSALP